MSIALRTVSATFAGHTRAEAAVRELMRASQWFTVTPLPDDDWLVEVKPENALLLTMQGGRPAAPKSRVSRRTPVPASDGPLTARKLLAALRAVLLVVDNRGPLPVLAGVSLRAEGGRLVARATDLSMDISVPLGEHPDIDVIVNAKILRAALSSMPPEQTIAIAMPDPDMVSLCDGVQIASLARACDYPRIPEPDGVEWTAVDPTAFADALGNAAMHASRDSTREHLQVIRLESERMVATDGHRAIIASFRLPTIDPVQVRWFDAERIAKLARKADRVEVAFQWVEEPGRAREDGERDPPTRHGHAWFRIDGATISARLVFDTAFPPYERLFDEPRSLRASVDRDLFLDAVKRVLRVHNDGGGYQTVEVDIADGAMSLTPWGEGAQVKTTFPVPVEMIEALNAAYQCSYIVDAVTAMKGTVSISAGGTLDPLELSDGSNRAIVMPMRR